MFVRPGPIHAGQAAILFSYEIDEVDPTAPFTLSDADGTNIPLEIETLPSGAAFLRASIDLEPGTYALGYPAPCNADGQAQRSVEVTDTAVNPSSLGELALSYEPYCSGATMDYAGQTALRPYPPLVTATITFSNDAAAYTPFIDIDVTSDAGDTWWSGLIGTLVSMPVSVEHASTCGPDSPTTPAELTVNVTARIVDGPTLPPLSSTVDVTCADCQAPPAASGAGGTGADRTTTASHDGGCACAASSDRRTGGAAFAVLAFATCVAVHRRRAARRDGRRSLTGF